MGIPFLFDYKGNDFLLITDASIMHNSMHNAKLNRAIEYSSIRKLFYLSSFNFNLSPFTFQLSPFNFISVKYLPKVFKFCNFAVVNEL